MRSPSYVLSSPNALLPTNKDPKLLKERGQVVKAQSLPILCFGGKRRGKSIPESAAS